MLHLPFNHLLKRVRTFDKSRLLPQATQNGFTLIELLVVFVLIGVLTGTGIAGFVSYNRQQALEQAALDIELGIDQAKQLAVSRVKPTGFSGPLDRFRITFCNESASSNNCLLSNSTNYLYEIDAVNLSGIAQNVSFKERPSTVILASSGPCGDNIRFYILKSTDNVSCTITLTSTLTGDKKTICVDSGGNAVIHSGTYSCS